MSETALDSNFDQSILPGTRGKQYSEKLELAKLNRDIRLKIKTGYKFIEPARGVLDFSGIEFHFDYLSFFTSIDAYKKHINDERAPIDNEMVEFVKGLPEKYVERIIDMSNIYSARKKFFKVFCFGILLCQVTALFSSGYNYTDLFEGSTRFLWLSLIASSTLWYYFRKKQRSITGYRAIAFCRDEGRLKRFEADKTASFDKPYSEFVAMARSNFSTDGYTYYDFVLNHVSAKAGFYARLKTYEDCQMLLALFNQYMDKTQPMPATPLFESIRNLDPVTKAAYDSGERQVIFGGMTNEELKEHQEKVRETCLSYLRKRNEYYGTTFSELPKLQLN